MAVTVVMTMTMTEKVAMLPTSLHPTWCLLDAMCTRHFTVVALSLSLSSLLSSAAVPSSWYAMIKDSVVITMAVVVSVLVY